MVTVAVMTMILKMRRRRDGVDEEDGDDDGRALLIPHQVPATSLCAGCAERSRFSASILPA